MCDPDHSGKTATKKLPRSTVMRTINYIAGYTLKNCERKKYIR